MDGIRGWRGRWRRWWIEIPVGADAVLMGYDVCLAIVQTVVPQQSSTAGDIEGHPVATFDAPDSRRSTVITVDVGHSFGQVTVGTRIAGEEWG